MKQTLEERRAKEKAWRDSNKDRVKANSAAWYEANRDKVCSRVKARAKRDQRARSLRKYGLTEALWDVILESQGGACPCGASEPGGRGTWHIDHDHATDRVRGLLCHHCNTGLGKLGDDYDVAIQRLEALRAQSERTAAILYPS
jgi:hypothetical protein